MRGEGMYFSIHRRHGMRFAWIMIIGLLIFCICVAAYRIDKLYRMRAQSYASNMAVKIVNNAVYKIINENRGYDAFSHVVFDENKKVTAVEGNTLLMNSFKSEITQEIQRGFDNEPQQDVFISIGSIFGTALLNNRGFKIPIRLAPVSNIMTDFGDSFESVGINNTRHSVYATVDMELAVMSYFSQSSQTISTTVPISETVIAGEVPSYYGGSMAYAPIKENNN